MMANFYGFWPTYFLCTQCSMFCSYWVNRRLVHAQTHHTPNNIKKAIRIMVRRILKQLEFCNKVNLYSYYFTGTFWSLKHISSHSFGPRDLKFTTQLANCLRLLKKEIFFRSNPQSRLQAQKGVISEGLEALLLPLEHCLLNRSC